MATSAPSWQASYSRRGITRRKFIGGSAATALILACGGGGSSSLKFEDSGTARVPGTVWNAANDWKLADETKEAIRGGIYRSVMTADQAGNYDALIQAPSQVPYSAHVHEFFMAKNKGPGVDPRSTAAFSPVPALADAYEFASDGMSVTLSLRPNVKWHPVAPVNGRVMDMDDWRTSLEKFLALSPQNVPLNDVLDKAEYPDARHMVWKFKYPYAPFLDESYDERFVPEVMPKELNANQNLAASVAIGTGYKILDKYQTSISMEYRKHADYWGGNPFIERWQMPIIPEYSNRYAQFVRGNIIDFTPTAQDVLTLSKDAPNTVIVMVPIPDDNISRIRFGRNNPHTLPWNDARVRVAIRRAINFKGIGEFLANKDKFAAAGISVDVVARTHVPYNLSYFLDPEKGELGKISDNYVFDVAEAKKLTAAAGFANAIDIDYWVLPASGVVPQQDTLVEDSLRQSGLFNIHEIQSLNTVAHRDCRSLGHCDGLVQSSVSSDVDHVIYRDYQSMGNTEGDQAYPDPRIDAVAAAQRKELDPQKRFDYIKDFQKIAGELMPAIPYVHQFTTFTFRWPWLHNSNYGSGTSNLEGRPALGGYLHWLDADMPNREKGAS